MSTDREVAHVDIKGLAASLPLDCPCAQTSAATCCRGGSCYHRTGIGGCDHCEGYGVTTQSLIDAAAAIGRAEGWKDAITCVQQTNPTSVSDSDDKAWAYLKQKIVSRLEAAAIRAGVKEGTHVED